ncbi:MAG: hypothetical protein IT420_01465 [Candidatus Brocadia sp.]|nr:hypothetical protein [Candidatus Brocadia sp.]
MKRFGYFAGVVALVGMVMTTYVATSTYASGCCGTKEASAAEKADSKCLVCGKAIDKDKGVKVECEGKSVTLCCNGCSPQGKKQKGCESLNFTGLFVAW